MQLIDVQATLVELKMKQRELARYMGVHANTVQLWCRGVGKPNTEHYLKLLALLENHNMKKDKK